MIIECIDNASHKIYCEALAYTGCRPSELLPTKVEDWDFKNKCVHVWILKKTHKVKLPKYFPEILEHKIKLWIKSRHQDIEKAKGFVFFNQYRNNHLSLKDSGKAFRKAVDRALGVKFYTIANDTRNKKIKKQRKLRYYTLKSLRKYFVSKIYDFSRDGLMSSRLLHHSSIDVSNEHYISLNKDKKRRVVEQAFRRKNESAK